MCNPPAQAEPAPASLFRCGQRHEPARPARIDCRRRAPAGRRVAARAQPRLARVANRRHRGRWAVGRAPGAGIATRVAGLRHPHARPKRARRRRGTGRGRARHRPWRAPLFRAVVLVRAYDQYAVQAFEAQAIDYLVKPIQPARLQKTVQKLQQALANHAPYAIDLEATMAQLRHLLAAPGVVPGSSASSGAALTLIPASSGNRVHMVPVAEVLYFEAADKYVRVLTAAREFLIRTPLKELIAQLDQRVFWQIHRSTLVRADAITTVTRDEAGKLHLELTGRPEKLPVSRLYAHLFKAM